MDKIMGALEHIQEEIEGLKEKEKKEELGKVLATGFVQPTPRKRVFENDPF